MLCCPRALFAALLLCAVAFLGGCDTDDPTTPLNDLEGVFSFSELNFDPDAGAIADADVLARLDESRTSLEVFGVGPALLRYRFNDETVTTRVDLDIVATRSSVRMTVTREQDASLLARLLLPPTFTLERNEAGNRLSGQLRQGAVDLRVFDADEYAGVPPVSGTLAITLARPSADDEN